MDYRVEQDLYSDYFQWLCQIVHADDPDQSYICLMRSLFDIPFVVAMDMDENRADDVWTLRGDFRGGLHPETEPSVLEVLVSLAGRINDEIMWNPDQGDRTTVWFWEMLENLGFSGLYDGATSESTIRYLAERAVNRWMYRDFEPNGSGSIFPLKHPREDQRYVEIWYQMHAYFLENYGVEEDVSDL